MNMIWTFMENWDSFLDVALGSGFKSVIGTKKTVLFHFKTHIMWTFTVVIFLSASETKYLMSGWQFAFLIFHLFLYLEIQCVLFRKLVIKKSKNIETEGKAECIISVYLQEIMYLDKIIEVSIISNIFNSVSRIFFPFSLNIIYFILHH